MVDFAVPNSSQKCDRVKMRLGDAVTIYVSAAMRSFLRILSTAGFLLADLSGTSIA